MHLGFLSQLFILVWHAQADKTPPAPMPVPLMNGSAKLMGESLLCEVNILNYKPQQVSYTVIEDGNAVTKTKTVAVPYLVGEMRIIPLAGLKGFVVRSPGEDPTKVLGPLDKTKIPQQFAEKKPVLISLDEKVKPEQVKDAKQGTVVLILPKAETPKVPEKK